MREYTRFAKNIGIVGFSHILSLLKPIILVPIFIKMLGTYDYGIWAGISVTIALLLILVELGLTSSIIRYIGGEEDNDKICEGFYSVFVIVFIIISVLGILIFVGANYIASIFPEIKKTVLSVKIFPLLLMSIALEEVTNVYFLATEQYVKQSFFVLLNFFIQIALISLVIFLGYGLFGALVAWIAANSILFLIEICLIIKQIGIKCPDFSLIPSYISLGLPIAWVDLLKWIVKSSNIYLIGYFMSFSDAGIYSAARVIGSAVLFLVSPLQNVIRPIQSKYWQLNNKEKVNEYFFYPLKYFLGFAIPSIFGLYILLNPILYIYTGKNIGHEGFTSAIIISVASVIYGIYSMCVWGYSLVEKTKKLALLWVITVFVSIILNIILIQKMGIIGGAIAVLCSYIIISIIVLLAVYNSANIIKGFIFAVKSIVSSFIMASILGVFKINGIRTFFLALLLGLIIYLSCMIVLNVFDEKEKRLFGKLVKKICKKR